MSQEKTSEKYKNRDWLYDQYIKQDKTIKQIAEEFGYSRTTLARYKARFSLSKNKVSNNVVYANKDWLYDQYITKNKTPIEISEICGVNRSTIFDYISKFGLEKKDEEKNKAYSKRIKQVSLDKYGVEHFNSSKEILEKRKETCLKKYGNETYLGSVKAKKKHGVNTFRGKTLYELGIEYNITNMILYRYVKNNPEITEDELFELLESYKPNISNLENIVKNKLNIDFYNKVVSKDLNYRPDFKIFDNLYLNVDGLYWHSELIKDSKYHFDMRVAYEERNLRLLQFRGDEVRFKLDIVSSMINNHLNKSKRIYARKTKVKEVSHDEAVQFLQENHLMGPTKAKHIGLYFEEKLVMLFSYKMYSADMKVERLCSLKNTVVVGGFSRLLKYALKIKNPKKVIYWVDLRYGTGNYLAKLGFYHKKDTLGWKWTDFRTTYNRLKCRANMDERGLTQAQYAEELGWYKIYDAGQRLWIKDFRK